MEYFWYVLAAIGAGVGTGLAGLSAATVMVPILIVLCPSFASENGAYQETAIALASDIVGSAVTAYTYIKHKNIDLKRGWIMMACILVMCTVGSYAAFKAGNVVLGGFTLFLTFFIGIRFLVKPDTSRENQPDKGSKLDVKGIIISLFFGLTIGFGTGFVGTGGGMMMLVVFTVFLSMELKTAVGTSTFIMTFTALIASVSHILIHPAILLEKWHVMLICIVVTTISSLLSARFANRVSNRVIGLTTGAVLTVLGATMIFLNYRDKILGNQLFMATAITFCRYFVYIASLALTLIVIHILSKIPKDIFRKLLHIAAFTSSIYVALRGEGWMAESLTLIIFGLVVWPLLNLAEKWSDYKNLFVEKKKGEVKTSLLLLFISQGIFLAIAKGILGKTYILVAATSAWGLGDIAAAWVGRPLGKHKVHLKLADHNKSWEGSAAMFAVAMIACFVSLTLLTDFTLGIRIIVSIIIGVVSSFSEMCSKNGDDTVIVPLMNLIVLAILSIWL